MAVNRPSPRSVYIAINPWQPDLQHKAVSSMLANNPTKTAYTQLSIYKTKTRSLNMPTSSLWLNMMNLVNLEPEQVPDLQF